MGEGTALKIGNHAQKLSPKYFKMPPSRRGDAIKGLLGELTLWEISRPSVKKWCERCCVVVITTAQLHSNKPELRFCAGSNPAHGVSQIGDGKDLWQWSRLETRLNTWCRSTVPQKQFIIIIKQLNRLFVKKLCEIIKWYSRNGGASAKKATIQKNRQKTIQSSSPGENDGCENIYWI